MIQLDFPGPPPAKNFEGAKSVLTTTMTSSISSQPWCDFFAMISLPTLVEETFIVGEPWASAGLVKWAFAPPDNWHTNQISYV